MIKLPKEFCVGRSREKCAVFTLIALGTPLECLIAIQHGKV